MTEADWLTATNPVAMLEFLRGKASERKLRLFAVACARMMSAHIQPHLHEAIDTGERLADDLASKVVPVPLINKFGAVGVDYFDRTGKNWREETQPEDVAAHFAALGAISCWDEQSRPEVLWGLVCRHESLYQIRILHEIIGNPFRSVILDACWLSSTVHALAQGIYADRAFDRMPILADAIQDAGCDNEDILNHCRGPGPHVKGCWVVDLILGKDN